MKQKPLTVTNKLVKSKVIHTSKLLAQSPLQPHVLPASLLYVAYAALRFYYDLGSSEFAWFYFILTCSLHALLFLIPQWSIIYKSTWHYSTVHDPYKADSILIVPIQNHGQGDICPVERSNSGKSNVVWFQFQKKKYIWNSDRKMFEKLDYLHHHQHSFAYYKKHQGLDKAAYTLAMEKYGLNTFQVPIPTFITLFKEHLVAPFFVFQIFCVCLWMLDDMWYFSLFTLFMLLVFESTVVFQRLKTLQEFRSMAIAPYDISVYRDKSWSVFKTTDLVPGDLVSITRLADDHPLAADFLLVDGSCIANEAMLSGESTPQLKESAVLREDGDILKLSDDKMNVLFGGTRILQVTKGDAKAAPDSGCLAVVLRTGFATQQGKLVRTIIYSTERVTANNAESLFFILFLLFFAIIASWYVWTTASREGDRDQTKLLLHCIMIITSVVPPELPMELSMAVNNSLAALAKTFVFCTEPFRIPLAGRIDVACFDKTGTLTAENLVVEGVTGLSDAMESLQCPSQLPAETSYVLAAAHALVNLDDGVIGDPMEKNTLESIGWTLGKDDKVHSSTSKKNHIQVVRRFPFSSALKRMSTVSYRTIGSSKKTFVACKGAPETLKSMFSNLPKDYDEHYKYWARRGKRVLALGYKIIADSTIASIRDLHRADVECKLEFAGFLIFFCPLKEDSIDAITMLNESSHRTLMITGDNALTACHIAKEVGIVNRAVLVADNWDQNGVCWKTVDEKIRVKMDFNSSVVPETLIGYDLCVTGSALSEMENKPIFGALLCRLWVYARVSPSQKEMILKRLRDRGYCTLMCGDGTNDVGALKAAHVGIALLDGTEDSLKKIQEHQIKLRKKMILEKQVEMQKRWNLKDAAGRPSIADMLQQASEQVDEDGEVPTIKFGDASVAAPFTSKVSSVKSVCSIVRQGRATLVALTQMYKILALNSLIMAYSLSVLHIAGIKQGDWQATVSGIMITICFFGLAKSTALEKLSKQRPQPNIFNPYIILSVVGQSFVHMMSLIYIHREALYYSEQRYYDDLMTSHEILPIDAPFKPNLLNSGVYLVSLIMQISTFAINYQGEPFRESIVKNKAMYNSLGIVFFIAFAAGAELFDELNSTMQLVPFPPDFKVKLLITMAADFGIAYLVEAISFWQFSNNKPISELFPDDAK